MPKKPRITKELVLDKALAMLVRDGYGSLSITAIARDIGCSTQPLSWHFGTMDNLRRALADHALAYADAKMRPSSDDGFEAFAEVGAAYLDIAFDEPKLFRFLYLDGSSGYSVGGLDALAGAPDNAELVARIASDLGLAMDSAAEYLRNTIVFTHGIAALVASGVMEMDKEQARKMVDDAGYAFLAQAGVDADAARRRGNELAESGRTC